MKAKIAVAGALLALAGPVCGAQWKPVSVTPNRSVYIDMDALVRSGSTVQAWDWQKFGTGQTSATWQGTFFWVKSLTSYHCAQRTTDAILRVYFGDDGAEIKRTSLEGLQFPAAVEPDSLREKLLEMACNPPKPPVRPVETATTPASEHKVVEPKATQPAPKPDASASTDKTATANSVPAKAGSTPAKAGDKAASAAKAMFVAAAAAGANPATPIVMRAPRQAYSGKARMTSKKKASGELKLALAKATSRPELNCPPPSDAGVAAPLQPQAPAPQLTDAGDDGMFN